MFSTIVSIANSLQRVVVNSYNQTTDSERLYQYLPKSPISTHQSGLLSTQVMQELLKDSIRKIEQGNKKNVDFSAAFAKASLPTLDLPCRQRKSSANKKIIAQRQAFYRAYAAAKYPSRFVPNTLPRFATSLPLLPVKSVNPYAWAFDHPMGARDLSVATDVPRSSTAFLSYSLPFMRLRRSSRAVYQATAHESLMHPMSRASARPTASTLVISPLVWRNLLQNWRTLSLSQQQRTFSRLTAELSQQGIDRVVIDSSDSFFAPPVIKSQLVLEEPPHVLPPTLEPIINISVVPGAEANTYTINAATKLRYFEGFDVEAKKIAATKAIAKLAAKTIYDLKKSEHSDKSPGEFRAILAESSVSISDATNDAYAQAIVAECHALGLVQAQSEQSPPTFSATILMSSMSDCMADCERISRANLSHHKEWAPITVGPP